MTTPKPETGLVIRHMYLWRDEAAQGKDEGRKARPCLVVYTKEGEFGGTEVFIAPITHTPPQAPHHAIEIPPETKRRLKLDHDRSWIVTTELNNFTWLGPDVRKTPSGEFAYGYLSPGVTKKALASVQQNARSRELEIVRRDDDYLKERLRKIVKNKPHTITKEPDTKKKGRDRDS